MGIEVKSFYSLFRSTDKNGLLNKKICKVGDSNAQAN